ncbi:McrC family protein [Streptomyces sp. NBC_01304]|uniref:McrC family protein n=1 Tax=Streptomyces sp. NBC_01304 TaxID=2903818 RepID=UPI002E0FE4EA|nr:McrC family protein [Streptomyces sp. NBC_01304]
MTVQPARITLCEYGRQVVEGVRLTSADRHRISDPRLVERIRVQELAHGRLELTAGPYVGVVQLDSCEIRVRPKYLGEELDVLRMLAYVQGRAGSLDAGRTLAGGTPNLRDLVALLFVDQAERLLARGVRRDYLTLEGDLPVVRGRLLPERQLVRHHGRVDRLACRFDEHDADILDNRLCAAAAGLAARTAHSPVVRARARRVAAQFARYAPTPLGDLRTALAGLDYHRHNAHYQDAHRWAVLLLTGGGIDDLFSGGPLAARAFLIDMNALFESFAVRLLGDASATAGSGFSVQDQARHRGVLHNEHTGRHYSEVRPDALLSGHRGGRPVRRPVDVKYKLYDTKKVSTADLYQAFLYAHALARQPAGETPTCVLLHPGGPTAARASVAVRRWDGGTSARVRTVPLDLSAVLHALSEGGAGRREALLRLWDQVAA